MRVAIGADHAGFSLKQDLVEYLKSLKHDVLDLGTNSADPVDYPDYTEAVGRAVVEGDAERGLLVCGSGVGASVAANKIAGIRAGLCHDTYSAHQGVEHDDMNVLVLGARVVSMPSWELFDEQPKDYRDSVLPPAIRPRLAVEAGLSQGWHRYVGDGGDIVGVGRFGASAPGNVVLEKFGFTVDHVVERAVALLNNKG